MATASDTSDATSAPPEGHAEGARLGRLGLPMVLGAAVVLNALLLAAFGWRARGGSGSRRKGESYDRIHVQQGPDANDDDGEGEGEGEDEDPDEDEASERGRNSEKNQLPPAPFYDI